MCSSLHFVTVSVQLAVVRVRYVVFFTKQKLTARPLHPSSNMPTQRWQQYMQGFSRQGLAHFILLLRMDRDAHTDLKIFDK